MYAELPDTIKQIVTEYLLADDFKTAKQIHDEWMMKHKNPFFYSTPTNLEHEN